MDSLTQATLGAAVGHLCWSKKIGNKALLLGAFGGTIPDLDIILYPVLDDVQRLYWHRGESHSVWFVILGSMLTGWFLTRYFKKGELPFGDAFMGAVLIYATHILIDYFTVYGTQLLAPLSRNGFALGNFFIVDPLFTIPLLVGCVAAALSKVPLGRRANVTGLSLAVCYMFWSFSAQAIADRSFRAALADEKISITRQRTTAGPFTTFLWRHVAEIDNGFLLGYFSVFDTPSKPIRFYYIPKRPELIERISGTRTFAVVEWFSQGWWYAIEDGKNRVKVVDLRFTEIPSTLGQTYHEWNWPFAWTFDLQTLHEKSLYSVVPELDAPLQTLALLTGRIRGGEDWYPTSTGISISATVTPKGALRHLAKEQQPM